MKTMESHFFFLSRRIKLLCCQVGVALVLGLLLAGCNQESGAAKDSDPAGTYTLATINGNKLPFTPPHEGGAPEVQSGSIKLNADGSFTSSMSYGLPAGKVSSRDFSGTYTREGTNLKLQWKGAGVTSATLEGDTFTMNNEGTLFAYRKQGGK